MRIALVALLLAACLATGAAHAQEAGPSPSASDGQFTFTLPQSRVVVKISDASLRPATRPAATLRTELLAALAGIEVAEK